MKLSEEIEKIATKISQTNKLYWINIGLDENPRKYVSLGLKNEKQADKFIDAFENYSDVTIFFVDNYGITTEDKFKERNKPIKIIKNPKLNQIFIKKIYNLVK